MLFSFRSPVRSRERKSGETNKPPLPEKPILEDKSKVSINFQPSSTSFISGETQKIPLSLYFAVDISGSMQTNINSVRTSISSLVEQLKAKGYDIKIGLIAFTDEVKTLQTLSSDVEAFINVVSYLKADGGGDVHEAALLAAKTALQNLQKEADAQSLKGIFLFTDALGHWGNGGYDARDCDTKALKDSFNGLSEEQQALTKLYYSVAGLDSFPFACGEYLTAKEQWDDVLADSLLSAEASTRGGALSYPVSPSVITGELGELIVKTSTVNEVCLASKAELKTSSGATTNWTAPSLQEMVQLMNAGQMVHFRTELGSNLAPTVKDGELTVTQCCLSREDVSAGRLEDCKTSTSKIPFEVITE